jgi:outer membrane lipoprotein-sorting protein
VSDLDSHPIRPQIFFEFPEAESEPGRWSEKPMRVLKSIESKKRFSRLAAWLLLLCIAEGTAWQVRAEDAEAAGAEKEGSSAHAAEGMYATTLGRSEFEARIGQFWSKGSLFRSETVLRGHPLITVVNGVFYYTYDELSGRGYAIRRSPEAVLADASRRRPFATDLDRLIADGGEKIREEQLGGIAVEVYRVTDDRGRRTLWVSADERQSPIRLETYDRVSGRMGKLDWINWLSGFPIPDAFFEPPENAKLERFESYGDFLERLVEGPIDPAPPLFRYFLMP